MLTKFTILGAAGALALSAAAPAHDGPHPSDAQIAHIAYTAGQIDTRWTDAIEADFTAWLRENIDDLPVARAQVEEILKRRQQPERPR